MSGTTTFPAKKSDTSHVDPALVSEPKWRVLLFNDDIHPYDLVVLCLEIEAGLSRELASHITLEAHTKGVAVVKNDLSREAAVILAGKIRIRSKSQGAYPGLQVEAEIEPIV